MHRLLVRYFLMVLPPLLGVVVLLQLGQSLRPPLSAKGAWSLDLLGSPTLTSACGLEFSHFPPSFTITQSGPQVQMTLNDSNETTLMGQINDDAITAEGTTKGAGASRMRLEARADSLTIPDRLAGKVALSNCPVPVTVEFVAYRVKSSGGQD